MEMLPPPLTKPISRPNSVVLAGEEKKEENAKSNNKLSGVSYRKIGHTTVAITKDLLCGISLIHFL